MTNAAQDIHVSQPERAEAQTAASFGEAGRRIEMLQMLVRRKGRETIRAALSVLVGRARGESRRFIRSTGRNCYGRNTGAFIAFMHYRTTPYIFNTAVRQN
mmetsp:Transcript_25717/g.55707  ORF Transcript_25717/g.55707 Transcript_25717/m.55707 type:complete len:101 (-) Transcript_25717:31-333(-)